MKNWSGTMGLKKARGVKSDVGVRLGNVRRMAGFIFRRLGPMWFWWDLLMVEWLAVAGSGIWVAGMVLPFIIFDGLLLGRGGIDVSGAMVSAGVRLYGIVMVLLIAILWLVNLSRAREFGFTSGEFWVKTWPLGFAFCMRCRAGFCTAMFRADLYFNAPRATGQRGFEVKMAGRPGAVEEGARLDRSVVRGRFRVRGREIASGKEVEFISKAATEELARRSAMAMGLEDGSVVVEII